MIKKKSKSVKKLDLPSGSVEIRARLQEVRKELTFLRLKDRSSEEKFDTSLFRKKRKEIARLMFALGAVKKQVN